MTRLFSKRQRKALQLIAGNICSICGKKLEGNFHADHITPFSKKGKTILENGQALCQKCNLKKGSSNGG